MLRYNVFINKRCEEIIIKKIYNACNYGKIMGWKTYLVMYFGTRGAKTSDIAQKVESLGFETSFGSVDFVYDWKDRKPTKEEVLVLGDKLVEALNGSGSVFNLDTHE